MIMDNQGFASFLFGFELSLAALPLFYLYFWYIAFLPIVIGFGLGLYRHRVFFHLCYGIVFSLVISFIGTLLTLYYCFKCLFPGFGIF